MSEDMNEAHDELAHKRAQASEPPPDPVRSFIDSGEALKKKFISIEEVRSSEGEAKVEPEPGKGWHITVENGTVTGWLFLMVNNLQQQLAAKEGLLFAAGMQVDQMKRQLAGEVREPGQRHKSGLVLP